MFLTVRDELSLKTRKCNKLKCKLCGIVWFQKIPKLTPRKIIGNSKGWGDFKSQNFGRKVQTLTGISRGVGGFEAKNLQWEGYGYFLEQLTKIEKI